MTNTDPDPRSNGHVLVVDDDPALNQLVALHLRRWGHRDRRAHSEAEMWRTLEAAAAEPTGPVELVLLDVHLGPADGSRLVEEIRLRFPTVAIVMVTRSSSLEIAVRSLRSGASDYLLKPIDFEHLQRAVDSALETSRVRRSIGWSDGSPPASAVRKVAEPGSKPAPESGNLHSEGGLLGRSPVIERVRTVLRRVAPTRVSVLVLGETGTGKELAARAVHDLSRSEGPFVAVNAAAIPRELIESELFGHERGAFTGATQRREGLCERAHGGTLFLDEIAEMDPSVQAKLLRFLQDGEVQRVGASRSTVVDVRVVAATNREPQESIVSGRLREDLYYRLRGVQLTLPPLREREDDVVLLAREFLARAGDRLERRLSWAPEALAVLRSAAWPGNVRQLLRLVDEVTLLADGPVIGAADLPTDLVGDRGAPSGPGSERQTTQSEMPFGTSPETLSETCPEASPDHPSETLPDHLVEERRRISEALLRHRSAEEISEALGISRATLYRKMRRYGLRRVR